MILNANDANARMERIKSKIICGIRLFAKFALTICVANQEAP